jgi:hypothetical protein
LPFEKDPNEIGALWLKSGNKGEYMTGVIDGVNVVCFAVKANSPKAPTWRVLKSVPRDEKPEPRPERASRVDNPNDNDDLGDW